MSRIMSQFDSALERREAAVFGMWAFLATEVLFFAPLFFGYVHGRLAQPEAFAAASHHMHIVLGTLNTAVLLTSSLTMALAVQSTQKGKTDSSRTFLLLTAALGIAFLGIKAYEYATEWSEATRAAGGEARFYFLYYAMTGLHAIHLTIGIGLVAWLWTRARRFGAAYFAPVEVTGLYWHFVDTVWVFLYPMFYLLERYR
jgi:cytochrome c oxidase subunit 3